MQVTTCPVCRGQGETIGSPCPTCQGRGLERHTRRKVVEIPAGVDSGTQIRLAGEGQPGENGGPNGHLFIAIQVKPHKFFRRREYDILLDLNINIAQARSAQMLKSLRSMDRRLCASHLGPNPGKS